MHINCYTLLRNQKGLAKKKEKGADCIMVSGVNYCKLSSEVYEVCIGQASQSEC